KYGVFDTSLGLRKPVAVVGPGLAKFDSVLPVAAVQSTEAEALQLPGAVDELTEAHWRKAFKQLLDSDDDSVIGAVYAAASLSKMDAPNAMRCRVGRAHDARPPEAVAVVADADLFALLEQASEPFIQAASFEEQTALVDRWGLRDASIEVRT